MPDNSKLELVVEVDVNKANASIKSINTGLSSMEQAATKAAHGASAGIDGMTHSMTKGAAAGHLLADAIEHALEWMKEWTIGAAEHAAHADRMGLSMLALAKAHGVGAAAAEHAVEAVKKVGFSTEDAIHAVNRLVIADMSLSKATGLAKIAKDAAAIENITAGEALEKLLMAIESGQSRGLRTMGIFLDLNKDVDRQEKLTGKTLDENEIRQYRYNAVMREGAKIQGAYAASAGSAEAQSKALAREVNELKEAVGEQFQGYFRSWIGRLRELVGFLKDNSELLVKFGKAAIYTAGVIATYGIITKIGAMATALQGLSAALIANPIGLMLAGVAFGGAAIWKTWGDTKQGLENQYEDMRRKAIRQDIFKGKIKPDDVKKMGYTDDQAREIIAGKKLLPGESWGEFSGVGLPKITVRGKDELTDDEVNRIAAERKKRGEAERSAQELYMRAVEERKSAEHDQARARIEDSMKIVQATQSETSAAEESLNILLLSMQEHAAGIEKIREEEKREIAARSTYVDDKSGAVLHFKLNASTLETIHAATRERIAAFDMKFNEEEARRIAEMWKAMGARQHRMIEQYDIEPANQDIDIWSQSFDLDERRKDAQLGFEKSAVGQRKELALANIEAIDAITIKEKIAVEQMKTSIEVDAIKQRTAIELQEIDRRVEADIRAAERAMLAKGIFDDARQELIRGRIRQLGQDEKAALEKSAGNDVDVAQIKGAAQTQRIVTDQYRSIFAALKQQAGGVFDALLTKSQSIWSAIGNSFKTTMLSVIKDVITSRVASMLMYLLTGKQIRAEGSGGGEGGGVLSNISGLLGLLDAGAGTSSGPVRLPAGAKPWAMPGESPFGPAESDPIRMLLLRNLEQRTRSQAEFDSLLAKDGKGIMDAGTALAANIAILHPVGNIVAKGLTVLADPSWKTIQATLSSFSPTEGGSILAGGPLARVVAEGGTVNPEQINFLFGKTAADMSAVGRLGGLARVRNQMRRQWEKDVASSAKQEAEEFSNSVYKGPLVVSSETTAMASAKLDAQFPWLVGAEKQSARGALSAKNATTTGFGKISGTRQQEILLSKRIAARAPFTGSVPEFATVSEAEQWAVANLGIKDVKLGDDAGIANQVVRGLADTAARGGAIPPRVWVSSSGFGKDEAMLFVANRTPELQINSASPLWKQPDMAAFAAKMKDKRWVPTADENTFFFHESGHYKHMLEAGKERYAALSAAGWPSEQMQATARKVSTYAATEPVEFVAEVYAGKMGGRKFSPEIEELYERLNGPKYVSPKGLGAPAVKEPWQMTAEEYRTSDKNRYYATYKQFTETGRAADIAADRIPTGGSYRGAFSDIEKFTSSEVNASWAADSAHDAAMAEMTALQSKAQEYADQIRREYLSTLKPQQKPFATNSIDEAYRRLSDFWHKFEVQDAIKKGKLSASAKPWRTPDAVDSLNDLPGRDLGFSGMSPDMKLGGLAGGEMMPDERYMGSDGYIHQALLGSTGSGSMRNAGLLGMFSKAGREGMLANLKSFVGMSGSIQTGEGMATTWQEATMGQKFSAIGKSDAALMGGVMLAMDGLRRGGKLGVAETTAGGAAIGYKFGGPIGAAIGGSIGLVAGIVRLFVKSAEEKVREKIKATYGIDISDKGVLKQIADTAKSAFGGNIDMAIRSQQIRDLIQLYAMSTGQKTTGMPANVQAVSMVQSGGSLFQSTGYANGTALPGLGGLPMLDRIGGGTASSAQPIVIPLQIDSKAVGTVIIQNGRVVAQGAISAMQSSAGRRELTSLQLSPGLLTS